MGYQKQMGIDLEKQFSQQQTIRMYMLEDRHEGIMFEILRDDNDRAITESGPAYELEKIMDEIRDLLANTVEKINDNHLMLRSQILYCGLRLEEINRTRDVIPIPCKQNIEHLNSDDSENSSEGISGHIYRCI